MNNTAIFWLVLLRLAIGWHLFYEGMNKFHSHRIGTTSASKPFNSESYFKESHGPFAGLIKSQLPDADEKVKAKLTLAPAGEGVPAHQRLSPLLVADLNAYFDRFVAHYGVDRATFEPVLTQAKDQAAAWLATNAKASKRTFSTGSADIQQTVPERIACYEAKLAAVNEALSRGWALGQDVDKARLVTLKADARTAKQVLVDDLNSILADTGKALTDKLTPEQKAKGAVPPPWLTLLDFMNYSTIALLMCSGACLLLGFCTRPMCIAAAGFLVLTYLAVPAFPWLPVPPNQEGNYLYVNKNVVEFLALLALASLPSGRWFGLDALFVRNKAAKTEAKK
jgi:uncharacterized membrane protein YphA (DoxX/SURF4 family)